MYAELGFKFALLFFLFPPKVGHLIAFLSSPGEEGRWKISSDAGQRPVAGFN